MYLYSCFNCSAWTNKLITAKDHASVQINIGHLNEDGTYNGQFTTFALTGKIRAMVSKTGCGHACTEADPACMHGAEGTTMHRPHAWSRILAG